MIVHHSISDLYKTLGLPCEPDAEFAFLSIPDIHPELPFASPVLRADYFSFILTKEGSGVYHLDEHTFPFDSQTLYFTNPGHIKSYELHESKIGYLISCSENFLRTHVSPHVYEEFPYLMAEKSPPQKLSDSDFAELESLYQQIERECERESRYQNRVIGNLLMVLLLKIKEKFWLEYDPLEEGKRDSQIVRSFQKLLEAEFKMVLTAENTEAKLQVQTVAESLNLHPNYLNSVIKSKTGRTVQEWITRRTLSTAKSLLLDTGQSAKEIAFRLGFSEPTHFSRFFKKHTQLSPSAFRKQQDS